MAGKTDAKICYNPVRTEWTVLLLFMVFGTSYIIHNSLVCLYSYIYRNSHFHFFVFNPQPLSGNSLDDLA